MPRVETCFLAALAFSTLTPAAARADEENGVRCSVAQAADVDGDGLLDIAVAARRREIRVTMNLPGRVWILSGRSGALLRTITGPHDSRTFGSALENVGDVDGDGATDLAVAGGNRVRVYSGADGTLLHELGADLGPTDVGTCISGGQDADGDGHPDIAIFRATWNGWEADEWPGVFGVVGIYSGKSGALLRAIAGPDEPRSVEGERQGRLASGRISSAVALVADRDGDGRAELALMLADGEPGEHGARDMFLDVIDPWSLERSIRSPLPSIGQGCPWIIRELDDLDGDGAPDLVLSVIEDFTRVVSGATGAELQHTSYQGGYLYGEGGSLDVLGDVNDDGVPDYLVAANEDSLDCDPGFVIACSGADGTTLRSLRFEYREGQQVDHPGQWVCGPGADACAIADVDGDGKRDVAVHVPRLSQVRILSGATFEELVRVDTRELKQAQSDDDR